MATPRTETYAAASGATVRGGRAAAIPAYLTGLVVGQIVSLTATANSEAGLDGFCGWTYDPESKKVRHGASGGHSNGANNVVQELNLLADNPGWVTLKAGTPLGQLGDSLPHNQDGTPNARHSYSYTHWAPTLGRIMHLGCYAPATGSSTFNNVDGYSPSLGSWAAANTFDPCQNGHYGNARVGNGDVWALWGSNSSRYWTEATATWSNPGVSGAQTFIRFPWAWDSSRNQLFGLAFGDSQGSGQDLRAVRMIGSVKADITLSGAGLTQFQADASINNGGHYAGMTYDAANDRFLWYCGMGASAGRIYAISPNGTTSWTITVLSTTGASLPVTAGGGVCGKMTYVDLGVVKGVVMMGLASAGCYFLRVA